MVVVLFWDGQVYRRVPSCPEVHLFLVPLSVCDGGIQSLSRALSKLMPETKDTASFFSFCDVTEKRSPLS